jgi:hypothetical protein
MLSSGWMRQSNDMGHGERCRVQGERRKAKVKGARERLCDYVRGQDDDSETKGLRDWDVRGERRAQSIGHLKPGTRNLEHG